MPQSFSVSQIELKAQAPAPGVGADALRPAGDLLQSTLVSATLARGFAEGTKRRPLLDHFRMRFVNDFAMGSSCP